MDGRPTPIHLHGGWCVGSRPSKPFKNLTPFGSVESWTIPNAICPVCHDTVFFYQNANGSRVFFDDLGWPWPKHPCTDNPLAQSGKIRRKKGKCRGKSSPPVRDITLFRFVRFSETDGVLSFVFRSIQNHLIVRTLNIRLDEFEAQGWLVEDIAHAPSFNIRKRPLESIVEFISVRRGCVGQIFFVKKPSLRAF